MDNAHYWCRVCGATSPVTATTCTNPGCRALLTLHGDLITEGEKPPVPPKIVVPTEESVKRPEVVTPVEIPPVIPVTPVEEKPVVTPVVENQLTEEDPGKQQGLIALILGIIAIAAGSACSCLFACLGGIIPFGCAVAGIIMGHQATNKSQSAGFKNTNAQLGTILSAVAIGIIVLLVIINAVVGGIVATGDYY